MTAIGRLDKRATFQRPDNTTDAYGNVTSGAFTELFGTSIPCRLQPTKGWERVRAGAVHAPMTATLTTRSDSLTRTLTESDRAVIDGVNWNIRSIANPDERNRFLEMMVEQDAGQ